MKATEQCFSLVLLIFILPKVVLPFEYMHVDEILKCGHSKLLSSAFLWYCLQDGSDLSALE